MTDPNPQPTDPDPRLDENICRMICPIAAGMVLRNGKGGPAPPERASWHRDAGFSGTETKGGEEEEPSIRNSSGAGR